MISENSFVITIGIHGSVVALHSGSEIKNKIFLENQLDDEIKNELTKLFLQNKSTPIYILLDTADQGYRKKTYPFIRKNDVKKLINRDMSVDIEKNNFRNYILSEPQKSQLPNSKKRWECLFISASSSEAINQWIEFLIEKPNRLVGIYMLPIESFSLFKRLRASIKSSSRVQNKKNDLYCVVWQNKVSDIRQTVFNSHGLVFTRIVSYNFKDDSFLERYEQDIYSTFEYLKRPFPELTIKDLDIINILPSEALTKLESVGNIDFNIINYTPFQAAATIGYRNVIPQNSNFCDLLISKTFFAEKKKILKFVTTRINTFEKLFLTIRASYFANLILLMMIGFASITIIYSYSFLEEEKSVVQAENTIAKNSLQDLKNSALDGEMIGESGQIIDIDRVLDIGKIYENFSAIGVNFYDIYSNLGFVKNFGVKVSNFSYSLINFNDRTPSTSTSYKVIINGDIANRSGDIDDLFKEFDGLTLEFKKTFPENKINFTELPRSIDFSKKYFTFPTQFTIENKNSTSSKASTVNKK